MNSHLTKEAFIFNPVCCPSRKRKTDKLKKKYVNKYIHQRL